MDKLNLDTEPHKLILGKSFEKRSNCAFHSIRYDFKPASVDTSQVSSVEIGDNNSVTVAVPHVEGSGTSHTVYKGNKRPCQKECVLIIDHRTGEFTLEKLANTIQLKKTRQEGHSRVRPSTPVDHLSKPKDSVKQSPVKKHVQSHSPAAPAPMPSQQIAAPPPPPPSSHINHSPEASSDSSSGSSDSSDSEDNDHQPSKQEEKMEPWVEQREPQRQYHSTLSQDLQLSDSGSDSD